jgi:hypothetical protein
LTDFQQLEKRNPIFFFNPVLPITHLAAPSKLL